MNRKRLALTTAAAAVVALAGTGLAPSVSTATTPMKVGFWAGQSVTSCLSAEPTSCPRDLTSYTDALWDTLEAEDGFLNLNLIYGSDFGPTLPGVNRRSDAVPLVQEANARGVEVNAWITMPIGKGTFSNENNAASSLDAVKTFKQWADANGLTFGEADLDLEFPLGWQAIQDLLVSGDPSGIQALASGNLSPTHQCAAIKTYQQAIAWADANGLRLSGSPILFGLDDLQNGDQALADLLDMAPMLPGYDELFLQAYRAFGIDLGSGLVASYYTEMQAMFGAKGQVSLGNTGTPPYNQVAPLVNDLRMLSAMGASKVPIFDLDQAVKTYGVAGVGQVLAARNNPMGATELAAAKQTSPTGDTARALFRGLDTYAGITTPLLTWKAPNRFPHSCP